MCLSICCACCSIWCPVRDRFVMTIQSPPNSHPPPTVSRQVSWKKVLYEQQPYPDNYVADSFLAGLYKNVNVNQYSLWQTFRASGIFTQEICLILIHYGFFNWIKYDYRALNVTQKGAEIISGCAYAFIVALFISELWFTGERWEQTSKKVIQFFLFTVGISYLLRSWSASNEKMFGALAFIVQIFQLLFADYGLAFSWVSKRISGLLLLVSCCFRCSLLTSGVQTVWFGLFSAILFMLTGDLLRKTRHLPNLLVKHGVSLLTVIITFTILIAFNQSKSVFTCFIICILLFNVICPALFHYLQSHKDIISGPWDEAQLDENCYERNDNK